MGMRSDADGTRLTRTAPISVAGGGLQGLSRSCSLDVCVAAVRILPSALVSRVCAVRCCVDVGPLAPRESVP